MSDDIPDARTIWYRQKERVLEGDTAADLKFIARQIEELRRDMLRGVLSFSELQNSLWNIHGHGSLWNIHDDIRAIKDDVSSIRSSASIIAICAVGVVLSMLYNHYFRHYFGWP